MRAFEEKEKARVRNAIEDHEAKAARKLRELREKNAAALKELEEIHVIYFHIVIYLFIINIYTFLWDKKAISKFGKPKPFFYLRLFKLKISL